MENKVILAICTTGYFNDRGCHIRILQVTRRFSKQNSLIIKCYSSGRDIKEQRIERIKKIFPNERDYIGFDLRKIILDLIMFIDSFKLLKIIKANKQLCFTHEAGIIGLLLKKTTGTGYWLDYHGSLHK
ncbi:MAG: hypothetical protein AB7T10_06970 [bacterium]